MRELATVLPLTVGRIHQHPALGSTRGKKQETLNRNPHQETWAVQRKAPKLQRSEAVAAQRRTEAGEETIMPLVREAGRKKRRRTEEGVPGGQGLERGGGHAPPHRAPSPLPLTGLAVKDGDPVPDPKTGGDPDPFRALVVESVQGGRTINKGARRETMAARETAKEDACHRTRDEVSLGQSHVPGLGPRPDRSTTNVVGLVQNHGQNHDPDPGKGGKITRDCNKPPSAPEIKWGHDQKTRGDTGLDRAQERGAKKMDPHPRVHRKLQGPALCPLKTKGSYRKIKKRRVSFITPLKRRKLLKGLNRSSPPVLPTLMLKRKTKTSEQTTSPQQQK